MPKMSISYSERRAFTAKSTALDKLWKHVMLIWQIREDSKWNQDTKAKNARNSEYRIIAVQIHEMIELWMLSCDYNAFSAKMIDNHCQNTDIQFLMEKNTPISHNAHKYLTK